MATKKIARKKTAARKRHRAPKHSHVVEPVALDFDKMGGLVPCVLQHAYSREVLMVGFMNPEAWHTTCSTGIESTNSTSRRSMKGCRTSRPWRAALASSHESARLRPMHSSP